MPTSYTQYNKWFKKAVFAALFLFFLSFPIPTRAQFMTFDPANLAEMIYENVIVKGWDLLKEHSGLLWKQTQVYFGTRLAQDAAIYLASGDKGQSSFIWNVSEINKLKDAVAGEYLDNLSKSYFGKSACQPGDLRTMVQVDLSARGLITGISNVRTRVCEEICQRTVMGTSAEITGVVGDAVSTGAGALGPELTDFSKIKEDLQSYANSAKDLMKEITKVENETRLGVGKYVWENVGYTLYGSKDSDEHAGLLSTIVKNKSGTKIGDVVEIVFNDPVNNNTGGTPQMLQEESAKEFQNDFLNALQYGFFVHYKPLNSNVIKEIIIVEHGKPFADLVAGEAGIFNRFYNQYPEAQEDKRYSWGYKDIDNFFKGNSVTAGLGLEALAKGASAVLNAAVSPVTTVTGQKGASLISFTFQQKYVSTDERQALLGDMFLELYASEMGNIYKLFAANEEAIKRKALLARPPNIPEIPDIIRLLQKAGLASKVSADVNPDRAFDSLVQKSFYALESGIIKIDGKPFPTVLSSTRDGVFGSVVLGPLAQTKDNQKMPDYWRGKVALLIEKEKEIRDKYPNLKQFTEAFQKFNQCVQACESAKLKEPKGTCTLDKITDANALGEFGVTGLTGGIELNREGQTVFSETERVAIGNQGEEGQTAFGETVSRKRKRVQVEDLQDFATIAFPGQNPLGQILDIALQTQGMSEEARRQAEVEAQAKDFKPKKSLISGEVKVTSDMNASRLDNALADVRAANNEYTDSVLAQMWGVFFNTLLKEFQERLYDKGLDPKLYGGAFNPITRQAFGKGVAAAEKQLGQVFKPNINPGGVITTQILTSLTSGCEKPASKKRFDECIIDENFKQAIEQRLTLAKATCFNIKDCTPFISGNGAFGFLPSGTEPQIQYGSGGTSESGQGIPYKSMIVLRKYRIIPASWEVAATWIRDYELKSRDGKPAPGQVTLNDVMNGFDDKTSAYYGLVNPNWVLKLPQYQCNRQGAGEEIITETPSENPGATNSDPFDVQITRADNYCADPASCIREKPDGTGCAEFGYCTAERDFWRFPSPTCQEINKTCQAYTAPDGKTAAYLEQSLDINNECSESSDGCTGFIRDYNYGRFIGEISSRGDGKSDTAFTFSPNRFTSTANTPVNATGFIDVVPEAFQCESLGKTCTYEKVAGRAEGCVLPNTNGVQCATPSNISTNVSENQRYWCGLPGGAGCFVGTTKVVQTISGSSLEYDPVSPLTTDQAIDAGHSTTVAGTTCVVGSWQYKDSALIFKAVPADDSNTPAPLTCSLYRSSEAAQPGTKRVYLNDKARACPASAAGCEQYYMIDFARDEYTRDKKQHFLTLEKKKEFSENLLSVGKAYFEKLLPQQKTSFDYSQIPISEITPASVDGAEFAKPPKIVPVQLNSRRVSCTEREVACRRYTAKGGGTVAAIIDPRANQCPNECVGFELYREPLTVIEKKLGSRAVATDPPILEEPDFLDRSLIPSIGFECPNKSADAGCEKFIKSDNEQEVIRMYLKDIRMCVNPDHKKDDGKDANAVYTIIESSATGATRPVNVELLQSDFDEKIYYKIENGKVRVAAADSAPLGYEIDPLYSAYHGPCTFMDPDQNRDRPVDRWQCNDIFNGQAEKGIDGIKQHLERCLTVNKQGAVVTDLANPDCREYIYFPPIGGGAERYAIPEDAPIYASQTCDVLKRGSPDGLAYPIDPQSQILKRFTCSESAVSCREYQGPGFQTNGALSLDFEGSETRWVSGVPKKAPNVNGLEDQAISFASDKIYYFDILSIPKDVSTAEIFDGKSFILSFWGKKDGSGSPTIALAACGYTDGAFNGCPNNTPFASLSLTSDWRSHRSAQLTPNGFVPTHLIITVPATSSFTLDNITLEMSTSIYLLRNSIEPAGEEEWNTPKSCNTDFTTATPTYLEDAQIGCKAYSSDKNESVSFRSYGLCRDEAVGCTAVINTFNTISPKGESFIPRGKTLTSEERPKNTYLTPPDVLEYVVVPSDPNSNAFCKREEVGCTLLGKETRDQTGKVIGFTETARIDDPENYSQGASSIACLVSENSCRLYKRNEDGSAARFKEPGIRACEWLGDEQSPTKQNGWFRKMVDADGNVTDDYEACGDAYEMLDSSIDYKIPRAKGYCVEKNTGRSVLNPVGSGYYPTAWCDVPSDCLNYIGDAHDPNKINAGIVEAQVVCAPTPMSCDPKESRCTWYKDPLAEGLGKHYFQIKTNEVNDGDCQGKVSDDAGCRLFNDTSKKDEPKLQYNAAAGRDGGTLDAALLCQNVADDDKNADDTDNPNDCDTNQLIEVERDRACGEWLACSSAIVTGKENETVCVERKPCNIAGGGECVNFVQDAKQSFESKELGDKSVYDRVSRLSGYSNEGFTWSRCNSNQQVATQKTRAFCQSGLECAADYVCVSPPTVSADDPTCQASQELLYVKWNVDKVDSSLTCATAGNNWAVNPVSSSAACVQNICQKGFNQGKSCAQNKECFAENELFFGINPPSGINLICGESGQITSLCGTYGSPVKPGFKPFDEISEIGGHADVVNGDFEDVMVDMASIPSQGADISQKTIRGDNTVKLFPAGWNTDACGNEGRNCKVVRRFDPATVRGVRNEFVRSGKYSLEINAKDAYATQLIENIIPQATYTLSGWINVTAGDSGTLMSGVGVDERTASEGEITPLLDTACNFSHSGEHNHCLRSKGTDGWEYFTTAFTTTASTRQILVTLINRGGGSVLFDDIQLRAHLQVSEEKAVPPSCRLYPESDSLNCDARDKQGNRIRGWRGYCIENDPRADTSDPRSTTQCLNWWPTDIIQGETNVLGPIEDAGYKGQAPLYYCAESMDKDPGVPLPRLVCLARNDPKDLRFEACKVIALVSDPKPKFYTLSDDDWRIGIDPLDLTSAGNATGGLLRYLDGNQANGAVSGLDVSHVNDEGGCLLVEGLSGWQEKKVNKGAPAFSRKSPDKVNYGGCTWTSEGAGNWKVCATDVEKYYHKTAVFVLSDYKGLVNLGSEEDGCKPDILNIYAWADKGSGYLHKSVVPYTHGNYQQVTEIPTTPEARQTMINKALETDPQKAQYYILDGFDFIIWELNDNSFIRKTGEDDLIFKDIRTLVPRESRPQQCRVIVQAVDEAGRNKMWSEKVDKGSETLPRPLSFEREDPKCVPYGAIPPVRSPLNIVLEPIDRATQQPGKAVQVPLELYHPENLENKDKALICAESHRGEGFYACGGICTICKPTISTENKGEFCLTDADCGGVKGSCIAGAAGSNEKAFVPNVQAEQESGLRRIQRVFAKIFEVWEWNRNVSEDAKKLQQDTGVITGTYQKLDTAQLGSAQDISNLYLACNDKYLTNGAGNSGNFYENTAPSSCDVFPGCRALIDDPTTNDTTEKACIPKNRTEKENGYRDYDYCAKFLTDSECPASPCTPDNSACVPAQNQYPNVKNIKVNDQSEDVILKEGQRKVSLAFDITLNPNQKPIKTVIVDWGDGSQTALSGLAWDAGHKTFSHTYIFYPSTLASRPATCTNYPSNPQAPGPYECRYRPRVKVVDNWGWCNGSKLVKLSNGLSLARGQAYVPTEVVSAAVNNNNTPEENGYSWGYYGGDCFKPYSVTLGANRNPEVANNSGDNAVYAMQSWDYFQGLIHVPQGDARTVNEAPKVAISFFQGKTDITADLLSGNKKLTTSDVFSARIDCKDDYHLVQCAISATGPKLNCIGSLNATLRQHCLNNTSCYAQNECQFEDPSPPSWIYTVTAVDDSGNVKELNNNLTPFQVRSQ